MSPPSRVLLLIVSVALLLPGNARGDEVAAYLQRHGLRQLLAVHLEQQLDDLAGPERQELILRLVGIYAQLLESTDDPAARVHLEQRSRRLLSAAAPDTGQELRLALLRGAYRAAEQIAEDHRLRQSSNEEIAQAKETLSEIIPQLYQLRGRIEERVQLADRRLARASGSAADMLAEQAQRLQRLLAQCTFLNAWALYYQSWLHDRPDNARVAEDLFAQLVEAESPRPQPQEISVDLRSSEAVARSILGMALCKSLTASSATAIKWIELLEHDRAYAPLRERVGAWKIAVYLEHGEYRSARAILADESQAARPPPLAWLRLAAVHALEAKPQSRPAAELARFAVTALAARGELQQVLDLAERYGVGAMGDSGFAIRYVKGVQHYDHARAAHGHDRPAPADEQLVSLYQQAIHEFEAALAEADADRYPEAAASCRWLIGWCHYFGSHFLAARDSFQLAAVRLGPDDAPEALWMAVVSLDKVVQADGNETLSRELSDLIDRVLALYPSGRHAPKLILKRAGLAREPTHAVVEDLLTIPPHSEVYDAAQRRAAQVLYQLFRNASAEQRLAYGNEYLAVAVPLVGSAAQRLDPIDDTTVGQYVARCRRVLEIALTDGIERSIEAGNVLAALDELQSEGRVDLSPYEDELDYRRVQERLLGEDSASADTIAQELWARDQASVWSRLAERSLFHYGLQRFRARQRDLYVDRADLDLVVRHGRRILGEFAENPEALQRRDVVAYHAAVADALMLIWERSGDPDHARAALELYETLLKARPTEAGFLRAAALLSAKQGKLDRALECWRTLVAGSAVGTQRWFEAKFHLISLLADTDPARARAVMDQHKQLTPTYGPEPWGSRLRALDLRIGPADTGADRPDDAAGSRQSDRAAAERPS